MVIRPYGVCAVLSRLKAVLRTAYKQSQFPRSDTEGKHFAEKEL